MNVLLLIGKTSTSHEAVAAEAEELRAQGHRVTLGTRVPPRPVLAGAVDEVVLLSPALPAPPAPVTPAPVAPAQPPAARAGASSSASASLPVAPAAGRTPLHGVVGAARRRVRWARGQVSGAITEPARCWRSVRRSSTVMALARESDVIVAVDAPMVRAVWQLGRSLPLPGGPEVVYGLPAAASAVARRASR